jgi:hypothetical protein
LDFEVSFGRMVLGILGTVIGVLQVALGVQAIVVLCNILG